MTTVKEIHLVERENDILQARLHTVVDSVRGMSMLVQLAYEIVAVAQDIPGAPENANHNKKL